MPVSKCCVQSCNCNIKNCTLSNFPRNVTLNNIWLDLIKPHSPDLGSGILKGSYKICMHHFESKYRTVRGRKVFSCPTLFTKEEIEKKTPCTPLNLSLQQDIMFSLSSEMPLKRPNSATPEEHNKCLALINHDHDYIKRTRIEIMGLPIMDSLDPKESTLIPNEMAPDLNIVVSTANEDIVSAQENESPDIPTIHTVKRSFDLIEDSGPSHSANDIVGSTNSGTCLSLNRKIIKRNRIIKSVENLTPKCKRMYTKFSKLIKSKRRLIYTYEDKMAKLKELCHNNSFETLIEGMTSAAKTFLLMQINQHKKKVQRRRFNNDEKIFALSLLKHSPKGYKFLQKMFVLPSRTTLNKFAKNFSIDCGLNSTLLRALQEITKDWKLDKKLCSIVFDEVALTPHLTFVESEDKIQGFVNFGNTTSAMKFCDHALVVMIRGVCSPWSQPIAYYLCEGSTPAITLKRILRDVVNAVAAIGLFPKALICDQGATFRACMSSFENDSREHQLRNDMEPDSSIIINGHTLHLIFDPPHLIKGIRNNFLDKDMIFRGELAKWTDIVHCYKKDCVLGDIRFLHKLTDEHVIPERIKKMKVKNATQVFSERVAAAILYGLQFGGDVTPTMKTTADAVLFFDRLFDSVNGSPGGRAADVGEAEQPSFAAAAPPLAAADNNLPVPTAPSLLEQARQERSRTQASAFTAGFVSRKLLKHLKCQMCKETFLTSDYSDVHAWITIRERNTLRGRRLYYPNNKFIRLFNDLIYVINDFLTKFPHNNFITEKIREIFLKNVVVDWFGCQQHHLEALNFFIRLVNRIQIHNWCNCINKILKGTDINRLSVYRMSTLQYLAFKKYKSLRCKK